MGRESRYSSKKDRVFVRGILDGVGYEVHDGVRDDWKAGDVAIVHMNCVHQHFNAGSEKPARARVMKPEPLIIFMNLLFQGCEPRNLEENFNRQ